tara:strand:+ start:4653 stop:5762 length:1110 start_codon:yes stop_codon:yes gene_type:complete
MAHIMDQLSQAVAEAHNYKKGYERLKEERQKIKEEIDDHFIAGDLLRMKEWETLEEENKKLKEEVKDLKLDKEREYDGRCVDNDENEAREKKLEEENKKLKEERDFFHQEVHKTLQCQADDMEEYEKQIKTLKEEVEWNKITIQKEVRRSKKMVELKEENKKLKADIDDAVENHFADLKLRETTHKEWDTLEQEIKTLKEHLAKKFYNHYDEMDYDKMFIAKTVGPNLENMVEHIMKQNKKLNEDNEYLHMKCETMEKENHKSEEEMMGYKDERRSGEEYDERMCRAKVVKRVEIQMVGSGDHHYWYYLYEDASLWRVERYPFMRKTYLHNKVLVCDGEGDTDNVKLVDSDYELKEDEMTVEYELWSDN